MAVNIDEYLLNALKEDITGEDVSTNAVMPKPRQGQVELICKEDGIVAGLEVFHRVFTLLDENVTFETELSDGDEIKSRTAYGSSQGRYPCPAVRREDGP
ncbi:quinolinate phosphoribosyl transferase domain-containing protein [Anaerostipes caccae]|nr:quinolinate phosphoribosyl transferase domain-containing protein [Anaerostipes caccae]